MFKILESSENGKFSAIPIISRFYLCILFDQIQCSSGWLSAKPDHLFNQCECIDFFRASNTNGERMNAQLGQLNALYHSVLNEQL